MSGFTQSRKVETLGMAVLMPFLDEKSDGRLILLNKGPLARTLQETVGDCVLGLPADRPWFCEIKIEDRFTGNLFLETWSNRNLGDRVNHAMLGSNPGWLLKLKSDLLLYYFLSSDSLYVFDLFALKQWAFCAPGMNEYAGRIYDFREVSQGKYVQRNDTWGRLVPLAVLAREVGYRLIHPKQLALSFADAGQMTEWVS